MTDFEDKLKTLYRKKREIADLEKQRSESNSLAGQKIAQKQAEISQAEKEVMDLCA